MDKSSRRAYSGPGCWLAPSIGFQKSLPYANSVASANIVGVGISDKLYRCAYSGPGCWLAPSIGFQKSLPYAKSMASAEILRVCIQTNHLAVPTPARTRGLLGVLKLSRRPHINTLPVRLAGDWSKRIARKARK